MIELLHICPNYNFNTQFENTNPLSTSNRYYRLQLKIKKNNTKLIFYTFLNKYPPYDEQKNK